MPHIEGIEAVKEELHGYQVTTIQVRSEQAEETLKKPLGRYITIEIGEIPDKYMEIDDIGECLAEVLDRILRPHYHGRLCICGIGNRESSADALGPEVVRNLPLKLYSAAGVKGNFCDVCSIAPGTPWNNNINTETILNGVVKEIGADCVLLVDSLVTEYPSRIFRTIQLSTLGRTNSYLSDRQVDWSDLGVPVISLGVPMGIPLSSLSSDANPVDEVLTSANAQNIVAAAGRIIAYAILRVCWPAQSKAECSVLSGADQNPVLYGFMLGRDERDKLERSGTSSDISISQVKER